MTWKELGAQRLLVYTTSWCPDCHRLKRVFATHGVACTEVDIDADPAAAARLRALTGRTAIPFVQINDGPMVRGWHEDAPGRFSEALFLAEAEAAVAGVGNA